MEKLIMSDTTFYKNILDTVDKINEVIYSFGFKLEYSISSRNKGEVFFTINHGGYGFQAMTYTFSFKSDNHDNWNDNYITHTVISYIKQSIENTISQRFYDSGKPIAETTSYEDPEKILEEKDSNFDTVKP